MERKIVFLLYNNNENLGDFINKLKSFIPKLKTTPEFISFVPKFFQHIDNKNKQYQKVAISVLLLGGILLFGKGVDDVSTVIKTDTIVSEILKDNVELSKNMATIEAEITFKNYAQRADIYLNRNTWKGTPLTGDILKNGAKKAFDKYGVIIPVEFALTQAQFESSMGRTGLSAKNNPFNVGEFDEATMITFSSTQEGVDAYYNLMAKDYLRDGKVTNDLLDNFVNHKGYRYASNVNYESDLSGQIGFTKRYIDSNIK